MLKYQQYATRCTVLLLGCLPGCQQQSERDALLGTWICRDLRNAEHVSHMAAVEITFNPDGTTTGYYIESDGNRLPSDRPGDTNRFRVDAGHIEFEGGTRYAFHIRDDELVMIHLEEADEIPVERRTVVFFRVK